jgi:hypothetical protein
LKACLDIPPRVTDAGEGGYALEAGAARNIDVTQFLHVLNLFATIGAVAVWSVLWREAESRDESFVSTRWTMVLKAGDSAATSVQALSALSELCQIYWRKPFSMPRARVEFRESPRWRACFSFARA